MNIPVLTEEKFIIGSDFKAFISRLRPKLAQPGHFTHNVPKLYPQENPPTRWCDVTLINGNQSVMLRIRNCNVYLDGYRAGDNTWWEFLPEQGNTHLIDKSKFLPFGGDYTSLAQQSQNLQNTTLGLENLRNAITVLFGTNSSTTNFSLAQSLTVVILMVCETARNNIIRDTVYEWVNTGKSGKLTAHHDALIHNWGALSNQLLRHDKDPTAKLDQKIKDLGFNTFDDVARALGLVLIPSESAIRQGLLLSDGRPLVEVFAVRILNIDGENPSELYGTIKITGGLDSQYFYNRESEHHESISPQELASLTGPPRAITAWDGFVIDVDLLYSNKEVSKGYISWNPYDTTFVDDTPITGVVKGKYGSTEVTYAVFQNAVEATMQIKLINGDGENPVDIYGKVTASNTMFDTESVLFDIKKQKYISVKSMETVPLSRSVVSVPLDNNLVIKVDLWDHDTSSPDGQIAKGTASFLAQCSGVSQKNISSKYGTVEVNVTWLST